MNASRYTRKVFYSEEDRGWIAVAPEISGCSAFGKTDAAALRELDVAIKGHLAVRQKHGFSIPKPISGQKLEGKILLRLPKALQRILKEDAVEEGISVNQYALYLISTARAQRQAAQSRTA
ncbi:MAG TPA: type II toxin-antitoxin system HicB family antitoxin [Elusimicrobiota bacterium]|nr:type II toxin-antitoxin system HicB family antitoxin [Elusimicrobiota bacterium]